MLNHKGSSRIETERLIIRKFKYDDCADMLKYWIRDKKIQSMYGEPVYENEKQVKEILDKYINGYQNNTYYRWAVILKDTSECIGQIAFFLVDSKNNFAEIEYCIGSKFQKRGLATEATKAVMKFGFDEVNLHKIQISHKENNLPSCKVISKCGFKYEGTLRDYFFENGKYIDRLFYSLLQEEYRKI